MKTPQDKAKELASKFNDLLYITTDEGYIGKEAKQCALVACAEILKEPAVEFNQYRRDYWQSVKNEISNL